MLTREDLENDVLRKNRDTHLPSLPLIPEQEFNGSLDRILAEPVAETVEGALDLRTVAAREQVCRLELLRHAGQA